MGLSFRHSHVDCLDGPPQPRERQKKRFEKTREPERRGTTGQKTRCGCIWEHEWWVAGEGEAAADC